MVRLLMLVLLTLVAWQGYGEYRSRSEVNAALLEAQTAAHRLTSPALQKLALVSTRFRCDGRAFCSEMTSCAEAVFFYKNCPDARMDRNQDGIPCAMQWCRR